MTNPSSDTSPQPGHSALSNERIDIPAVADASPDTEPKHSSRFTSLASAAAMLAIIGGAALLLNKLDEHPTEPVSPAGPAINMNGPTVPKTQYVALLRKLDKVSAQLQEQQKVTAHFKELNKALEARIASRSKPHVPPSHVTIPATTAASENPQPAPQATPIAKTVTVAAASETDVALTSVKPGSAQRPSSDRAASGWVINVLSTTSKQYAEKRKQRFEADGFSADIVETGHDTIWYGLRLTGFASRESAEKQRHVLANKYNLNDAWVHNL